MVVMLAKWLSNGASRQPISQSSFDEQKHDNVLLDSVLVSQYAGDLS